MRAPGYTVAAAIRLCAILLPIAVSLPRPAQGDDQSARLVPASRPHTETGAGIRLNGAALPYPVWFTTVMPGTRLEITLPRDHDATVDGNPAAGSGAYRFWTAPQRAGTHQLSVTGTSGAGSASVAVFVLEPASEIKHGRVNGFRIGQYPVRAPRGFIRLNADDVDTPVAPNFKVGQFRGKQQPDHWPKYLLLTQNLVKRLQHLLDTLRADGVTKADTLFVMSGFRSPFYNTAIGATARSRHMWGDAADVYIDVRPEDGLMDDLNRDSKITKADANWLYDFAEKRFAGAAHLPRGGLGSYRANAVHGPFVHIDGRGLKARWGR